MNPNNDLDYGRMMQPRGLAGQTSAPANVEEDTPPGAPPYSSGPLANPMPSATPKPTSLSTLADGGTNHATAWMAGDTAPVSFQQPFNAQAEADVPPGAPGYASGPLANQQATPTPTPDPRAFDHNQFNWSSAFTPKQQGY